jgi:hypothetical protein
MWFRLRAALVVAVAIAAPCLTLGAEHDPVSALRFVSGWDASGIPLPAAGLGVLVDGVLFVTDSQGLINVPQSATVHIETLRDATRLPRITLVTAGNGGKPISVWSVCGTYDTYETEEFVSWVFFGENTEGGLQRVAPNARIVLVVHAELAERPLATTTIARGMQKVNGHGIPHVAVKEGDSLPSSRAYSHDVIVDLRADPNDDEFLANPSWLAFTRARHDNPSDPWEITSAEIVLRTADQIEVLEGVDTLLHEMGHARGLQHSPYYADVMYPYLTPGHMLGDYSAREAFAMRMQNDRIAGTHALDDDRGAIAALGVMHTMSSGSGTYHGWVSVSQ